jgi:mannose-6-phosphate isomerase-like protein (cupin superfamily)
MPTNAVNLAAKFDRIQEYWKPKIVAEVNDFYVKLVKFRGAFVWHHHEREDELFQVLKGRFRIELRDGVVDLRDGELAVIPRGIEHRPVADEEVHVLLLEPKTTVNTGSIQNERTVEPEWI